MLLVAHCPCPFFQFTICHVHYRKIGPIVRQTAEEFGIPYKSIPTFFGAIAMHAKMLKDLGKEPVPAPVAEEATAPAPAAALV